VLTSHPSASIARGSRLEAPVRMEHRDCGPAFSLSLLGDPQDCLRRFIAWAARSSRFVDVRWHLDDIECSAEGCPDIGAVLATSELSSLLHGPVIDLRLSGQIGSMTVWRIIIRDGATIDVLGHGDVPTYFELGGRYTTVDNASAGWT
jgi:hypothetical protein